MCQSKSLQWQFEWWAYSPFRRTLTNYAPNRGASWKVGGNPLKDPLTKRGCVVPTFAVQLICFAAGTKLPNPRLLELWLAILINEARMVINVHLSRSERFVNMFTTSILAIFCKIIVAVFMIMVKRSQTVRYGSSHIITIANSS